MTVPALVMTQLGTLRVDSNTIRNCYGGFWFVSLANAAQTFIFDQFNGRRSRCCTSSSPGPWGWPRCGTGLRDRGPDRPAAADGLCGRRDLDAQRAGRAHQHTAGGRARDPQATGRSAARAVLAPEAPAIPVSAPAIPVRHRRSCQHRRSRCRRPRRRRRPWLSRSRTPGPACPCAWMSATARLTRSSPIPIPVPAWSSWTSPLASRRLSCTATGSGAASRWVRPFSSAGSARPPSPGTSWQRDRAADIVAHQLQRGAEPGYRADAAQRSARPVRRAVRRRRGRHRQCFHRPHVAPRAPGHDPVAARRLGLPQHRDRLRPGCPARGVGPQPRRRTGVGRHAGDGDRERIHRCHRGHVRRDRRAQLYPGDR